MQICNYPGLLSTLKCDPATPLARLLLPQSAGSNGSTLKCDPATALARLLLPQSAGSNGSTLPLGFVCVPPSPDTSVC